MKQFKKVLILACVCMLTLAFSACGSNLTEVDVSPFVTVRYSGTGDNLTAAYNFSFRNLEETIMKQWDEEASWEKLGQLTALEATMALDRTSAEGLRTGDKVTVEVTYDKDMAQEAGYKFVNTKKTFEVGEFTAENVIDPFDTEFFGPGKLMDLQLTGVSPDGSISLIYTGDGEDAYKDVHYSASKVLAEGEEEEIMMHLKNGDHVQITAELSKHNMDTELTRSQIEIEVQGLDAQVTDVSMIRSEDLPKLQEIVTGEVMEQLKQGLTIKLAGNKHYSFQNKEIGSISPLSFTDYGFAHPKNDVIYNRCIVVPFTLSISDCTAIGSVGSEYFQEEQSLDFPGVCSFATVTGLVVDPDGKVISDSIHVNIGQYGSFYETEDIFLQSVEDIFEDNSLVKGNFN